MSVAERKPDEGTRGSTSLLLVSHLASPEQVTGAERSLLNLAEGFRARGREVHLLVPGEGRSVEEARERGIPVEVRRWPRLFLASHQASALGCGLRSLRFLLGAPWLRGLARAMARRRPAAVLVNTLVNVGAAWAAGSARLPVVWRVAEIPGPGARRRLFQGAAGRLASRVVAVSGAVAEALGPLQPVVIPSGVRIPAESEIGEARRDLRARLGLPPESRLAGHVGQLRPHKGQLEFVEAALRVGQGAQRFCFVVMGSEKEEPRYAARIRERGARLGSRLRFAGFVPGAGSAAAAVDLLVFTSLVPDPFPLVVLEAMAAGVPVLAFAGGGVPEAVQEGVTGRLVEMGETGRLAAVLGELLEDEETRQRMGKAARRRAAAAFDREHTVDRYLAVLDEVSLR